jgi:hypothetical protein
LISCAIDTLKFLNISQRPARLIGRIIHPELHPEDSVFGWSAGTGGWGEERLKGFENDMNCENVDQYLANEITPEEIYYHYMARGAPVLIRGLFKKDNFDVSDTTAAAGDDSSSSTPWKAVNKYEQRTMIQLYGSHNVQVRALFLLFLLLFSLFHFHRSVIFHMLVSLVERAQLI